MVLSEVNLMSTYQHTVDAKGRMSFPTKFREQLGLSFIITVGMENNLYAYSKSEWANFMSVIKTIPLENRKAPNFLVGMAREVEPDSQGRILLPQQLRDYAGIERNVTVRGVINRAEIWDSERFDKYTGAITGEEMAKAFANFAF